MRVFKIFEGLSEDGKSGHKHAIAVDVLGVINDDDAEENYITKPEDWFAAQYVDNVVEIGEITIDGDHDLLYDAFSLDCDCC